MTAYVLIVTTWWVVTTHDFSSKETCEVAKKAIETVQPFASSGEYSSRRVFCFPK